MLLDWADNTAQQLLSKDLIQKGICLILGAADTGKTTLAAALATYAAKSGPVGIIDADIGQSRIGPPTTVGWALIEGSKTSNKAIGLPDSSQLDFSQLALGLITDWQDNRNIVAVRAPKLDIQQIRCLVIGDVTIDIDDK